MISSGKPVRRILAFGLTISISCITVLINSLTHEPLPPALEGTLAAVFTLLLCIAGFHLYANTRYSRTMLWKAMASLSVAMILFAIHTEFHESVTVPPPGNFPGSRLPIGFGLYPWSLTQAARDVLPQLGPNVTPTTLLEEFAAFNDVPIVWRSSTIRLAKFLDAFMFLLPSIFAVHAIATFLKYCGGESSPETNADPSQQESQEQKVLHWIRRAA